MSLNEKQIAARKTGGGASEAGAILGIDPWRTKLDVYERLIDGGELEQTLPMRIGQLVEEPIAVLAAEREGWKLRKRHVTLRHKDNPFILATLDREIVGEHEVLEIKSAGSLHDEWGPDGSDQIPDQYLAQVHQQMAVRGVERANVATLFFAQRELRIYRIDMDRELADMIIEAWQDFWKHHIEPQVPPDPVNLADLRKRFPNSEGDPAYATPAIVEACERLNQVKGEITTLEKTQEGLEYLIKYQMKDSPRLLTPETDTELATWKSQSRKGLDADAIRRDEPEIAKKYQTTSKSRVFRVKK